MKVKELLANAYCETKVFCKDSSGLFVEGNAFDLYTDERFCSKIVICYGVCCGKMEIICE